MKIFRTMESRIVLIFTILAIVIIIGLSIITGLDISKILFEVFKVLGITIVSSFIIASIVTWVENGE